MASSASPAKKRRVGVVGFGHLGQYLAQQIQSEAHRADFEIAFVWNRTKQAIKDTGLIEDEGLVLDNLDDFASRQPDIVVEVSHPEITKQFGCRFVEACDLFVGSPTAFADDSFEKEVKAASAKSGHGIFVATGALWGAHDIQKLARLNRLQALHITMRFHPLSVRSPDPATAALLEQLGAQPTTTTTPPAPNPHSIKRSCVRDLCAIAPNNVNTMAVACLAAHTLGFDGVTGELIVDPSLETHNITVEVTGVGSPGLRVVSERVNPAKGGAVTGTATLGAFWGSLLLASGGGAGVHLC